MKHSYKRYTFSHAAHSPSQVDCADYHSTHKHRVPPEIQQERPRKRYRHRSCGGVPPIGGSLSRVTECKLLGMSLRLSVRLLDGHLQKPSCGGEVAQIWLNAM